jgi:hypothetical protein
MLQLRGSGAGEGEKNREGMSPCWWDIFILFLGLGLRLGLVVGRAGLVWGARAGNRESWLAWPSSLLTGLERATLSLRESNGSWQIGAASLLIDLSPLE